MSRGRRVRRHTLPAVLVALLIVVIVLMVFWTVTGHYDFQGNPEELIPETVEFVETRDAYVLLPSQPDIRNRGFAFYPGGKVDPRAYIAPLAHLASEGTAVFILKAPFDLAVFMPRRGMTIRTYWSEIEHWMIGGHSLGGIVAANQASRNPQDWSALVLFASYATSRSDLSSSGLPVLSIYGDADLLVPPTKARANARYLPVETMYVNIPGGNHSGFGDYGFQSGDGQAGISLEDQYEYIRNAFRIFLSQMVIQP